MLLKQTDRLLASEAVNHSQSLYIDKEKEEKKKKLSEKMIMESLTEQQTSQPLLTTGQKLALC